MTKRNTLDADALFELTPSEFERLVAALIAEAGYSSVAVVGGPSDHGVDVIGEKDGRSIAVQVKHKKRVSVGEVQQFIALYFADQSTPRSLIFATSADIPENVRILASKVPTGASLTFLGAKDILKLLSEHRDVASRFFQIATERENAQRSRLFFGLIGSLASMLGLILSLYSFVFSQKQPLDTRIATVEKALTSISDLETYLRDIKHDMVQTERETEQINQRNAQAKELEKVTDQQMVALRATLQSESWQRTALNYFLGFVFGVASSFLASVLHARWVQRKALQA